MSGQPLGPELDCSDQRLIFRLLLAEVRKLRAANFSASVALAGAKPGSVARAMQILDEARGVKREIREWSMPPEEPSGIAKWYADAIKNPYVAPAAAKPTAKKKARAK